MDVVTDGSAAEIDVEIRVTTSDRHQAIFLHFGVLHRGQIIGAVLVRGFEISGPCSVDPIQLDLREINIEI